MILSDYSCHQIPAHENKRHRPQVGRESETATSVRAASGESSGEEMGCELLRMKERKAPPGESVIMCDRVISNMNRVSRKREIVSLCHQVPRAPKPPEKPRGPEGKRGGGCEV